MKTSIYLLILTFLIGSLAHATTSWQGTTGGWSDAGNWTSGEPTNGNDAQVNNGGTAEITQAGEQTNGLILGTSPGQTGFVNMSGGDLTCTTNSSIYVGYQGTGTFTQSGGVNQGAYHLYLGYLTGSNGGYELSGTGSLSTTVQHVGDLGVGNFTQSGGTNSTSTLYVGEHFSGAYTVSAGSLTANTLRVGIYPSPGTFKVIGDASTITINTEYRQATLNRGHLISEFGSGGISLIDVAGTAYLDGTWSVIDPGNAPFGTFNILQADGGFTASSFDTVNLPNTTDWSWGVTDTAGTDTLWVQHVPETSALVMLVLGGLLGGSRARSRG